MCGTFKGAQCMKTAKVFGNYGDCKRKRVCKDFSAFVHAMTAKPFGNYIDCIVLCDIMETFRGCRVNEDCKGGKR